MKARGRSARTGDVIPYIFCLGNGEASAKSAQADRAKHPDEIRKADSGLSIGTPRSCFVLGWGCLRRMLVDYQYYLSQQILPPIERLCEPIEGTDRSRLAECLGKFT